MLNPKFLIIFFLINIPLQILLNHSRNYYYKNTRKSRIKNLKRKKQKRKLLDLGAAGGGAGGAALNVAKDDFKVADDSDFKVSGGKIGLVMRIDRPEESKPLYINMSPMYDFRKYV